MHFFKNNGIGLLQVMLAGAILAGISVASLKMFNTQKKSIVFSTQQYEEQQLIETIKGLLTNEDSCTQTFLLAPASGSLKNLQSYNGTNQIVAVGPGGNKNVFVKNQSYGKQGLMITNYELNDSSTSLSKYFGMSGTPTNTATNRIKYSVLYVTVKRREATDNDSGFGSATMRYGIPLIVVTDVTVPANRWLIQSCRAASGGNGVWSRTSADVMNIYYADGMVGIGLQPISTGATVALVQINGDTYVDGSITVSGSASVNSANIGGQLVIPVSAPSTPENGMMWVE